MGDRVTWRRLISRVLENNGETWEDVEHSTLTEAEYDEKFDNGYGGTEGCPFTVWTKNRVYFPAQYDGSEWCDSVPRNPCSEATTHIGGG